jgi:LPS export ABC transporter protein LptC
MVNSRKRMKRALTVVIVLSLLAVAWTFIEFQSNRQKLQKAIPQMASKAVMALSRVSQTATKDGAVQWKMEAAGAELEAGTGRMILQSPEVHFFMEDGTKVHLTARQGILNTRSNDMEVRGDVSLRNDRYTLTTESLFYKHDNRILRADKPVDIAGGVLQLRASDMVYDLKANQAQFGGRVKGTLNDNFAL